MAITQMSVLSLITLRFCNLSFMCKSYSNFNSTATTVLSYQIVGPKHLLQLFCIIFRSTHRKVESVSATSWVQSLFAYEHQHIYTIFCLAIPENSQDKVKKVT